MRFLIALALVSGGVAPPAVAPAHMPASVTVQTGANLKHYNVTIRRFNPAQGMASGQEFVLPVDSPDDRQCRLVARQDGKWQTAPGGLYCGSRGSAMTELSGKVAVVTGAARGIGRAAAIALAKAGADVVGVDVAGPVSSILDFAPATADELADTGRAVEASGRRWLAVTLDQRNLPALRDAATKAVETMGGIDILFANAGIQAFKPILEMEDADWHDQIDVNLSGTMNAIRAFAPAIKDRAGRTGHGRIIVTSSTQGQHGTKHGAAYSASKWGIIGLMKSAALEFGEHGITVNALIPGLIDTALTRHEDRYAQVIEEGGKQPSGDEMKDEEQAKQALRAKTPLGVPWIDPDDVAPMVVFLASDAARMASGGTYAVTAGDSAHGAA